MRYKIYIYLLGFFLYTNEKTKFNIEYSEYNLFSFSCFLKRLFIAPHCDMSSFPADQNKSKKKEMKNKGNSQRWNKNERACIH